MKLGDKEIQEVIQKVVKSISDFVLSQIATKHLYVLDVHVDLQYLNNDKKYILDVFVYIDANPFCRKNLKKLINDAIEEGLKVAKKELKKYNIEEVEF